jgi:hypothetical protein
MMICPGVDGLRGEFPDDFPSHHAAFAAPRFCRGLDHFGDDFFARVQHVDFSLFAGFRPLGPLLYHFYVDGNLGPMCSLALIVSVVCITLIVIARRLGGGTEIEGR